MIPGRIYRNMKASFINNDEMIVEMVMVIKLLDIHEDMLGDIYRKWKVWDLSLGKEKNITLSSKWDNWKLIQ